MKKLKLTLGLLAMVLISGATMDVFAADAKETTISGKMICANCSLKEGTVCQNVIQVEKDGKTINYYLAKNDTSEAMHDSVCGGKSKVVTATGTVVEKNGKEVLTATKLAAK